MNPDLTQYLSEEGRSKIGRLLITPEAVKELGDRLATHELSLVEHEELVKQRVANSVTEFILGGYFTDSQWFREQKTHSCNMLRLKGKTPEDSVNVTMRLTREGNGFTIESTGEALLPEDYFDQRVIAETKAEYFPELKS